MGHIARNFIILLIHSAIFSSVAFAVPKSITLQAKIIQPNSKALEAPSVNFQITTLDPLGSCVLYVETFSSVSMAASGGLSVLNLGLGVQTFSGGGANYTDIFNNTAPSFGCQGGGAYTPAAADRRKIVMQFNDSSGAGWQTVQSLDVNSVPFSNFAGDSVKFDGHPSSDFALNSGFPDCNTTGKVLTFNGTAFTCVSASGGAGTVTNVTSTNSYLSVGTGTTTPALTINVGTVANTLAAGNDARITGAAQKANNLSDLASATTARTNLGLGTAAVLDAGVLATNLVQLDGTAKIPAALLPASSVTTSTALVGDVTGTIGATVVSQVGTKTAAQVAQSVTDTLAATNANTASTIVKRDASGNVAVSNLSATNVSTQNTYLYDSTITNKILLKAPGAGITDYTFTLPAVIGTANQIIGYNNAGTVLENKSITAGAGVSVTHSAGGIQIAATGSGGTVTNVSSANADIDVATGASTPVLTLNSGTGANQILKLDGTSKIPAVDGSLVTNLDPTQLSAAVPITKGGTGAITANAGLNNLLPTQAANAGKVLQTDGVNTSWVPGSAGSVTSVNSANTYLSVATTTTTPVITANVGTAANTLAAGDDTRIVNAVQQSAYNGDVANVLFSNCDVGSTPKWDTGTDMWICVAIGSLPASAITTGTVASARLGSGTADGTTYLRGDGTWVTPPIGNVGTVTNVSSANSYLSVATGTSTPVLTANIGTAANTLAAGDDSRITGAAQKANNLSDLGSAPTARTNLGLGTAAVLDAGVLATNLVQLDGTAKIPAALLPTSSVTTSTSLVGDVTGTIEATVVSLVGTKTAAQVAQSVTDTLAATNVNTASTIVKRDAAGNVAVSNLSATNVSTQNTYLYDGALTNKILLKAPAAGITDYTFTLPPVIGTANQIIGYNNAGTVLENKSITAGAGVSVTHSAGGIQIAATGSGGTVTNVSSANADIAVATGASTPVLTLNSGTGANQILKLDGASKIPAVDGSLITNLDPTHLSAAVGVAKGGTGAITANAGLNNLLPTQATNAGKVLQTDGTNTSWVAGSSGTVTSVTAANSYLSIATTTTTPVITANVGTAANTLAAGDDARIVNAVQQSAYNGDVANVLSSNCDVGSTPKWDTGTDMWICVAIGSLPASAITTGTVASARLGSGTADGTTYLRGDGTWVAPPIGNVGTVTNVSSANSYLSVATGTSTPVLTANIGAVANTLAAGDDARITGAAQKANNLSDLASAPTARTNLGLGTAAVLDAGVLATNLVQLDGTAKIPAALLPASSVTTSTSLVGDVTGTIGATVVSLVGTKTAAQVAQSVTDTLAATNVNTFSTIVKRDASGNIAITSATSTNLSTQNNYLFDATNTNRVLLKAPSAGITDYTFTLPPVIGTANQIIGYNNAGTVLENKSITAGAGVSVTHSAGGIQIAATGGGGTVTSVTSANADIAVATGTATPVLTLNSGTGANQILKLDATSKIPAVEGSLITNLDPTHLSAAVPINKGGTGATTAVNGLNNLLPTQTLNAGKVLQTDGTNTSWVLGSVGTVTSVTSANSYLSIATTTSTPVLTANVGVVANTLAAGDDSRFTNSRAPNGSASGDLSGSYPGPAVAKIQGNTVASGSIPGADVGKVYRWDGTNLTASFLNFGDLKTVTGSNQLAAACLASEKIQWSVITDSFTCQTIGSLNTSAITAGTMASARLGSGTADATTFLRGDGSWVAPPVTQWTTAGSDIYYSTGKVGIGVAAPAAKLHVRAGGMLIDGTQPANSSTLYLNDGLPAGTSSNNIQISPWLAGNVTNATGIYIQAPTLGAYNMTNYTGLSVDGVTGAATAQNRGIQVSNIAAAANNYAIYSNAAANSYFAGNVGVGTTSPANALSVSGSANVSGTFGLGITAAPSYGFEAKTNSMAFYTTGLATYFYASSGLVNIGSSSTPLNKLGVGGGTVIGSTYVASTAPTDGLIVQGNVGVGTTTPTAGFLLDVVGDVRIGSNDLAMNPGNSPAYFGNYNAGANADMLLMAGNSVAMTIKSAGNVGIGTAAPSEKLEVNGNVKATAFLYSSDRRLKEDIRELASPLDTVRKLHGVNFKWKESQNRDVGFIAQEVEAIVPDVVHTSESTGLKSVKYGNLVALTIEAIKDLYKKFDSKIHEHDIRLAKLEEDNKALRLELDRQRMQMDILMKMNSKPTRLPSTEKK